ncbi:signal transduction histidine kinase [Tamaricihabitans halophyticus]|uniref:histidine kinase n=1 Tax=Tamaricihabitans halophyticus TaxID=1262583 RepID=A0A4R2QSR2_9PSEU|nr:sensor histidine kinase [Tamaricihabitans halophyticus]TCP52942.1 signal transduction histidine kinase [Tamaricihabitans halophyticus]
MTVRTNRRVPFRLPPVLDIGIAIGVAIFVAIGTFFAAELQHPQREPDTLGIALVVLTALSLAWRRRAPQLVLAACVGLLAGYLLLGYPYGPIQLCMVFAMFELARQRPARVSLRSCAAALVGVTAALAASRLLIEGTVPATLLAVWTAWLIIPWSVGALVHVTRSARIREQRELVARAALEERMRMAREVHDVAGHGFSAVAMQAGVALLVFDEQPDQTRRSLEAIKETSATALTELRTMLSSFPHGQSEEVAPQGLDDIDALARGVRAGGLDVRLSVPDIDLPEDIGRAAYRIAQEALTNALRHAGPATAEVTVRLADEVLVVEVRDNGVGAPRLQPGRGLAGMRERVAALGGSISTWSPPEGGFIVSAKLPLGGGEK